MARLLLFNYELVGQVVFVDIGDIGHRLPADLLGGDQLDVVEPDIGIELAFGRQLAELFDAVGPAL